MARRFSRLVVLLVVAALVWGAVLPAVVLAQEESVAAEPGACKQAEKDVEESLESAGYMFGGFMCGIFGWAFAAMSKPRPPEGLLVGKSPEYVETYLECYERAGRSKNQKAACGGWLVGSSLALLILTLNQASSSGV